LAEFRDEDPNALTRAAIPPKVTIDRKAPEGEGRRERAEETGKYQSENESQ
jgi:hypothetical protein